MGELMTEMIELLNEHWEGGDVRVCECVWEWEAHTLMNNTVCASLCARLHVNKGVVVVVMAGGTLVIQVWKEDRESPLFCVITT